MIVLIRFLFLLVLVVTFMLNLTWRQRVVVIGITVAVAGVATIIVLALEVNPSGGDVVRATPIPRPTIEPAPTRPPEGPSYETACRSFRLMVDDIEAGDLDDYEARLERVQEVRNLIPPDAPPLFMMLINEYVNAVDRRLGTTPGTGIPPGTNVDELDREIRRARDDVFSECRARRG